MYIKTLQLKNYRNYEDLSLNLEEGLNFVIGKNAAGKTNILESIYFLENGKSHRTNAAQELISWNEEFLNIAARVVLQDREIPVEASITRLGGKQLKVNGVVKKRLQTRSRPVLTVLFTPDHLKIVKEMPDHRRAYLDEVLEKIRSDYGYWRQQYSKILRQRNMLLKKVYTGRMKAEVIDYWDKQLVVAGVKVIEARRDVIKKLQVHASVAYKKIAEDDVVFTLEYENQLLKEVDSLEFLEERFLEGLVKKRKAEIERGQTLVGPHRDDMGICVDGVDLRTYGSQGEQRSASLALKMAELLIIMDVSRELPILLLDDVMSELDRSRRKALLEQIREGTQVIITSTQADYLKEMAIDGANVIKIEDKPRLRSAINQE